MLQVERTSLLWAAEPKNYTGAAMAAKYVSLKNFNKLIICILTGAWAAGTAAVTLTQATAVAGTGAKTLAFTKQWNDVTTSGTLAEVAVASNTFNLATANKIHIIEIDATTLDVANGFDCVTLAIASPGANNDFYGVLYQLAEARYPSVPPAAVSLTD